MIYPVVEAQMYRMQAHRQISVISSVSSIGLPHFFPSISVILSESFTIF